MWDYIINIHQSELLRTKTKEFKINEHNFLESNVGLHHKYPSK